MKTLLSITRIAVGIVLVLAGVLGLLLAFKGLFGYAVVGAVLVLLGIATIRRRIWSTGNEPPIEWVAAGPQRMRFDVPTTRVNPTTGLVLLPGGAVDTSGTGLGNHRTK